MNHYLNDLYQTSFGGGEMSKTKEKYDFLHRLKDDWILQKSSPNGLLGVNRIQLLYFTPCGSSGWFESNL